MKFLILFFFALIAPLSGYAQVKDVVTGKYTPGFLSYPNFVKNPNCFANTRNISVSGSGAVARTTTLPLENLASCSVSGATSGDKITFDASLMDPALRGQNCEARVTYQGVATKWKFYVSINGSAFSREVQLEDTGTYPGTSDSSSKTVVLSYPCGDLSAAAKPVFEATASTPLTFKVTSIHLGANSGIQNISPVGPWTTGTCTSTWTTNTTTTCKYRQVGDSAEIEFANTMTGAPNAASLTFTMPAGLTIDTSKLAVNTQQRIGVGTFIRGTYIDLFPMISSSTVIQMFYTDVASTFPQYVAVNNTIPSAPASGNVLTARITVPIVQFHSSSSVYSSSNADTDWAACNFSTLAWQGLGTVTNNSVECRRQGPDLLMRGTLTVGATSGSQAQIPLPLWNGSTLTSSKSATAGRIERGVATLNSTKDFVAILSSGASYFTVGIIEYATAQSPFTSQNGNAIFVSGEFVVLDNLRIPITGWTQSNSTISSFAGHYYNSSAVLNEGEAGRNTIQSGTWTPVNAGTNTSVTAVTFGTGKYLRVGNMVHFSGYLQHNVSSVNNWGYSMTLPSFVTTNFVNGEDCSGTIIGSNAGSGGIRAGVVFAETNRIRFSSGVSDTGGVVGLWYHAVCLLR